MLNITTEVNGTEVVIYVEGRMDTATSPQLQAEVDKHIASADKIILDIAKLEYVSSAGLRVFLTTDQGMLDKGGELNLKNVPKAIMDVFEMTGFSPSLSAL